jgi:hypothetical protein
MRINIFNIRSGSWLSGSTWNTGEVPDQDQGVYIGLFTGAHKTVVQLSGFGVASALDVRDELDVLRGGKLVVDHIGVVSGRVLVDAGGAISFGELKINTGGIVDDEGRIISNKSVSIQEGGVVQVGGELVGSKGLANIKGFFETTGKVDFYSFKVSQENAPINKLAAVNTGTIEADYGGIINFHSGYSGPGTLIVNRGEVDVTGRADPSSLEPTKGDARLIGEASILKFLGGGSLNVLFHGVNDTLFLSRAYTGKISGFATSDKIDVLDQPFNAALDRYDGKTQILQVGSAEIKIVGTYNPSDFTFATDGNGGTLIGHI